jgi:hypothetical protein
VSWCSYGSLGNSRPPRFTGVSYPCIRCGSVAQILRLSLADLRHNGFALYREGEYVNWCGRAQAFVPLLVGDDLAGLVPILGEAS